MDQPPCGDQHEPHVLRVAQGPVDPGGHQLPAVPVELAPAQDHQQDPCQSHQGPHRHPQPVHVGHELTLEPRPPQGGGEEVRGEREPEHLREEGDHEGRVEPVGTPVPPQAHGQQGEEREEQERRTQDEGPLAPGDGQQSPVQGLAQEHEGMGRRHQEHGGAHRRGAHSHRGFPPFARRRLRHGGVCETPPAPGL